MTALENLYYGNIAPHEYEVERSSEYDVTAKLVIRHEQKSLTFSNIYNILIMGLVFPAKCTAPFGVYALALRERSSPFLFHR